MKALRILVWLIILTILVAVVWFAVQNPEETVRVSIWQYTFSGVPLVFALFIAFLVGVVLTLIFGLYFLVEQSVNARRLRREKKKLERELAALRNLALDEPGPAVRQDLETSESSGGDLKTSSESGL